jgi:hypothetical protein
MAYIRNFLKWMMEHLIFMYRNKCFKITKFSVATRSCSKLSFVGWGYQHP